MTAIEAAAPRRVAAIDPDRVSIAWLMTYLASSGVVLAAGARWALVALHVALLAVLAALIAANGTGWRASARVLAPLFVWPFLYFELPSLMAALGAAFHDQLVQGWELALFGAHPSQTFAAAVPWRIVSETLHAGYLAYYPTIFLPALISLWRNERRAASEFVLALGLTSGICWTLFVLFPVEGPRYLWQAPRGVPAGVIRDFTTHLLAAGSSRGAAFPSSHMAIATVQAVVAARWSASGAVVVGIIAALIGLGAIYGGFHYAIDIVAGAALGAVVGISVLAATRPR